MAHCLSEWTGKKHSSIVQSSERTQRSSSQSSVGRRDLLAGMCVTNKLKYGQLGPETFF